MIPTKFRFIWPSGFRGEDFKNRPIRNKNCLWWPCLIMDRDETSNLNRGPSIDASYQVSVHLAEGFQRRRLKCEKLTDDKFHSHRYFIKTDFKIINGYLQPSTFK
jgi:hypothetical protein